MSDVTADLIEKAAIRAADRVWLDRAKHQVVSTPSEHVTAIVRAVLDAVAPVLRAEGAAHALRQAADDLKYAGSDMATVDALRDQADQHEHPNE